MPPKGMTQEEYNAKTFEAEQKAREDREARERQDRAMGFFDRLWNNFGLFDLILICLVIGGLWFAAKANPDFVDDLVEKLPKDWQPTVNGALDWLGIDVNMKKTLENASLDDFRKGLSELGIDKDAAAKLVKNQTEQKALIDLIARENGGKIKGSKTLINDKTLFALCRDYPEIVAAAASSFKGDKDQKLTGKAQEMIASFRTIIADGRMDTLLKGNSSPVLFDVLNKFNSKLAGVIRADMAEKDHAGAMSQDLKNLLVAALTPNGDKLPAAEELQPKIDDYLSKHKGVAVGAAEDMRRENTPQGKALDAVMGNNGGKAYAALISVMSGADETEKKANALELLKKLESQTGPEQLKLALSQAPALLAYATNANLQDPNLPKELREGLTELKSILTNNGGKGYQALVAAKGGNVDAANALLINLKTTKDLDQLKLALQEAPALRAYANATDFKDKDLPTELRDGLAQIKAIPEAGVKPALNLVNQGIDPRTIRQMALDANGKLDGVMIIDNLIAAPGAREILPKANPKDVLDLAKAYGAALPAGLNEKSFPTIVRTASEIGAHTPTFTDEETLKGMTADQRTKARENNVILVETVNAVDALVRATIAGRYDTLKTSFKDKGVMRLLGDDTNNEAIHMLLETAVKDGTLPSDFAKPAGVLVSQKNWDTLKKLAKTKVGAEYILGELADMGKKPDCSGSQIIKGAELWLKGRDGLSKNIIGENYDQLVDIGKELQAAQCTKPAESTSPTSRPRPVVSGGAVGH